MPDLMKEEGGGGGNGGIAPPYLSPDALYLSDVAFRGLSEITVSGGFVLHQVKGSLFAACAFHLFDTGKLVGSSQFKPIKGGPALVNLAGILAFRRGNAPSAVRHVGLLKSPDQIHRFQTGF